jgi:hypothetical protein
MTRKSGSYWLNRTSVPSPKERSRPLDLRKRKLCENVICFRHAKCICLIVRWKNYYEFIAFYAVAIEGGPPAQPDRCFADVPVLGSGWIRIGLASDSPGLTGRWWRRARDHGSRRRRGARADYSLGPGDLV